MEGPGSTIATGRPLSQPFEFFDLVLAYLLPLDTQFIDSAYRTGATKFEFSRAGDV